MHYFHTIRVCFLIAFMVFSAGINPIYAAEKISILTEQNYPMNYTLHGRDDGEIIGFATELAIAVLEEAKVTYEIQIGPWARAIQALNTRENVIVFSMTRTPAREDKYIWLGKLRPMSYWLWGLKKDAGSLPRTLNEAKDFRVGVDRAGVTHDYFHEQGFENIVVVNSVTRYLATLNRGRVDIIPYNKFTFGIFVEKEGFNRDDYIAIVNLEDISTYTYLALSKQTNPELVLRLKQAYQIVRTSGKYDEIMNRHDALIE